MNTPTCADRGKWGVAGTSGLVIAAAATLWYGRKISTPTAGLASGLATALFATAAMWPKRRKVSPLPPYVAPQAQAPDPEADPIDEATTFTPKYQMDERWTVARLEEKLATMPHLTHLDLRNAYFTTEKRPVVYACLRRLFGNPKLEEIHAPHSWQRHVEEGLAARVSAESLDTTDRKIAGTLTAISAHRWGSINPQDVLELCPNIHNIDLAFNCDSAWKEVAFWQRCPSAIYVSRTEPLMIAHRELAPLLAPRQVTLVWGDFSEKSWAEFPRIQALKQEWLINFEGSDVTDAHLAALAPTNWLTLVDAHSITLEGIRTLCETAAPRKLSFRSRQRAARPPHWLEESASEAIALLEKHYHLEHTTWDAVRAGEGKPLVAEDYRLHAPVLTRKAS